MKFWIIPILCTFFFCGCSSISTTTPSTALPWYEDLNPMTDQTTSDWALFDLDAASYKREPSFSRDIIDDTMTIIW